jgi:hypothetical protein
VFCTTRSNLGISSFPYRPGHYSLTAQECWTPALNGFGPSLRSAGCRMRAGRDESRTNRRWVLQRIAVMLASLARSIDLPA